MDNTIDALKNLYVAMGGNEEDDANLSLTPDMINAIAAIQGQGGGGAVTAMLTGTLDPDTGDLIWTCDKTNEELVAAISEKKVVQAVATISGVDDLALTFLQASIDDGYVRFTGAIRVDLDGMGAKTLLAVFYCVDDGTGETWYLDKYGLGTFDVDFQTEYDSTTGEFNVTYCSWTNAGILAAVEAGLAVRGVVEMSDSRRYLTQIDINTSAGLVAFYGVDNFGRTLLLYQSNEDEWVLERIGR